MGKFRIYENYGVNPIDTLPGSNHFSDLEKWYGAVNWSTHGWKGGI